ncbi:PQQ-binding-like beta-propeller repeat protein [Streptomyces sp. NPDC056437]|uniref:outer membrane protein assembly factor BamB family protein n=1 Tax=Streptomyces sp. NPDC056437 TaxID=3345816 RepID=UPI00367A1E79
MGRDGDGAGGSEAGLRKQGRQPKVLPSSLPRAQRDFAELIRVEFFDRLANLGATTAAIYDALGEGFSGTTLSRFRSGERVPDRDKLLRLLAYAEDVAGQPLPGGVREQVMEVYYAALRATDLKLHDLYRTMDERDHALIERDEARAAQERHRADLVRCQESLQASEGQVRSLKARIREAAQQDARTREREAASEDEIVRLQEQHEVLMRASRMARAEQRAARGEIGRLQDLLAQQGELTSRTRSERDEQVASLRVQNSEAVAAAQRAGEAEQQALADLRKLQEKLDAVTAESARTASSHALVLRSRGELSEQLAEANSRQQQRQRDLDRAQQAVAEQMRKALAAERKVADLEQRLVAAFRSRDALLDAPASAKAAVTEAEDTVDAAWRTVEREVARIETSTSGAVSDGESTLQETGLEDQAAGAPEDGAEDEEWVGDEPAEKPAPQDDSPDEVRDEADPRPSAEQEETSARRENRKENWAGVYVLTALALLLVAWMGYRDWADNDQDSADSAGQSEAEARWTLKLPQPLGARPVIERGVVVVPAWHGEVYGADASTGKLKWTVRTGQYNYPPLPSTSGLVHLIDHAGTLRTVNPSGGQVTWTKKVGAPDTAAASPAALVTVDTQAKITALRPVDGTVLWEHKLPGRAVGRMTITQDTAYILTEDSKGTLYAFDLQNGKIRWQKALLKPADPAGLVVAGSSVVVDTGGVVFSLDLRTGRELWRREYTLTGVGAADSSVVCFNAIIGKDDPLLCLDVKTGKELWRYSDGSPGRLRVGDLSIAGGWLYIAYNDEQVFAANVKSGAVQKKYFQNTNEVTGVKALGDALFVAGKNQRIHSIPVKEFR